MWLPYHYVYRRGSHPVALTIALFASPRPFRGTGNLAKRKHWFFSARNRGGPRLGLAARPLSPLRVSLQLYVYTYLEYLGTV